MKTKNSKSKNKKNGHRIADVRSLFFFQTQSRVRKFSGVMFIALITPSSSIK